jgi:beta-barrel assembly-enhancing protease
MAKERFHPARSLTLAVCLMLSPCLAHGKSKSSSRDANAIGTRDVGKGLNFYSLEKETELGKRMAQEVERDAKVVSDPIIAEYVNRLGQNLARNSDAKVPFTIKILDAREVNAFALPGGFLFVNSGLILIAGNEAEFAGVMAHEIAHVAARHSARQASRSELAHYATLPLIFAGNRSGYAVYQAASVAIPIVLLRFSHTFEAEADMLGLQYMDKAGYDPVAFVDFFEKIETLEKTSPGLLAKVFSTHPMTVDRIRAAQENILSLPSRPEYVVNTSEFMDIRARLITLLHEPDLEARQDDHPTLRRSSSGEVVNSDSDGGRPKPIPAITRR